MHTDTPDTLPAILAEMRDLPEWVEKSDLRHYADRIEAATAPGPRADFGNDLAPDGRTLGVFVGSVAATHTFATPEDARAADGLIDFLSENLTGTFIERGGDRWPSGKRPADIPLAPPLAAAFAPLSTATVEAPETAASPAAVTPEKTATSSAATDAAGRVEKTPDLPPADGGERPAPSSAPARNCDRFRTAAQAAHAFNEYLNAHGNPEDSTQSGDFWADCAYWLFAPAEGGAQ